MSRPTGQNRDNPLSLIVEGELARVREAFDKPTLRLLNRKRSLDGYAEPVDLIAQLPGDFKRVEQGHGGNEPGRRS